MVRWGLRQDWGGVHRPARTRKEEAAHGVCGRDLPPGDFLFLSGQV